MITYYESTKQVITNLMMVITKQQSNDGDGNGIIDGDRFTNLSVGNKEGNLMQNRHLHADGLNDKNLKVGGKVRESEMENRHLHANGLNDKNLNAMEKGEKVVMNRTRQWFK